MIYDEDTDTTYCTVTGNTYEGKESADGELYFMGFMNIMLFGGLLLDYFTSGGML